MSKTLIVIPARYDSTRFPGKPLAMIAGRTMLERVWERSLAVHGDCRVIVATDSEKIQQFCNDNDMDVIMTSREHVTGTDRVAEVAQKIEAEIYVNVQGDQPIIPVEAIHRVIARFEQTYAEGVEVTVAAQLTTHEHADDESVVKAAEDLEGYAMYFSRRLIPSAFGTKSDQYLVHYGLYAFTRGALARFANWDQGPLEKAECVEMMRFIEHGEKVANAQVPPGSVSVDLPEHVEKIETLIKIHGEGINT